jgi:uncharacterized repeat protein (TIGR03943 family)
MVADYNRAERPVNWVAVIEIALLAATAAVLLTKALRGVLVFYIHPRYTPLIVACGILLLLVAAVRVRSIFDTPEQLYGKRTGYMLLLLPVLLGTLIPARALGAGSLASSALNADVAPLDTVLRDLNSDSSSWNLLAWVTALSVQGGDELSGKPADVVGFVYRDPARPFDGFFVTRYVITCCTADGNGVGLPVVWKGSAALSSDAWVRVRATLGTTTIGGVVEPALIATEIELVPPASPPYLYP